MAASARPTASITDPYPGGQGRARVPYPWSVYRWLDGEPASIARVRDTRNFATALARFLSRLGRVDATDAPTPGQHNLFRGAPLSTYGEETVAAIEALADEIPVEEVKRVWADANETCWDREPVWFHGDMAASNVPVRDARLAAVIDLGSSGVGDPACDTVIALTQPDRTSWESALSPVHGICCAWRRSSSPIVRHECFPARAGPNWTTTLATIHHFTVGLSRYPADELHPVHHDIRLDSWFRAGKTHSPAAGDDPAKQRAHLAAA